MKRSEKSQSTLEYLLLMGMVVVALWMFCRQGGPLFNYVNENPGGGGPPGGPPGTPPPVSNPPDLFSIPRRPFGFPGGFDRWFDDNLPVFDDIPAQIPPPEIIGKDNAPRDGNHIVSGFPGQFAVKLKANTRSIDPATDLDLVQNPDSAVHQSSHR